MTKEEYGDFVLRYKGCGACFPMYLYLNRFEKKWFSAIQKDVADLEDKLANADYQLEGRDNEIKELQEQNEKLIDFVLSKNGCCDVCPITDTCINNEGTCPYAGILAKSEEEVTREWLMQKIAKEIKENG